MPGRLFKPISETPQRISREISDKITTPKEGRSKLASQARGFLGGSIEGAGDMVADAMSPAGLALTLLAPWARGAPNIRSLGRLDVPRTVHPVHVSDDYIQAFRKRFKDTRREPERLSTTATGRALEAERQADRAGRWTWKDIQDVLSSIGPSEDVIQRGLR